MNDDQTAPSANSSQPSQGFRRLFVLLIEVCLLVALAFIVYSNQHAILAFFKPDNRARHEQQMIAQPSGDTNAEQEAAAKLKAFKDPQGKPKYLVVMETIEAGKPEKRVTSINYMGAQIDDETAKLTSSLYRISTVNAGSSNITDDQIKHLSGLSAMISLVLGNTPITDKGMVHLRPLVNMQALYLPHTKVSDRGLDDIACLDNLKILDLSGTKVTDKGMKKLLPLTNLEWLLLSDTAIADAGLDALADMKHLRRLTIGKKTSVTAAGVARLKKANPVISIDQ